MNVNPFRCVWFAIRNEIRIDWDGRILQHFWFMIEIKIGIGFELYGRIRIGFWGTRASPFPLESKWGDNGACSRLSFMVERCHDLSSKAKVKAQFLTLTFNFCFSHFRYIPIHFTFVFMQAKIIYLIFPFIRYVAMMLGSVMTGTVSCLAGGRLDIDNWITLFKNMPK